MADGDLFQQFLKKARAANPFEKTADYAKFKLVDQLYKDKRREDGAVSVNNKYYRPRQEFLDAYDSDIAKSVQEMIKQYGQQQASGLAAQKQSNMESIETTRKTALQQLNERNAQLRQQADRVLDTPPAPVVDIPTLNPVQGVGSVAARSDLAGANASQQPFFVNPDRVQASYNITPAIGGGIGNRTKQSTDRLVGQSDTLGTMRKDEF